MKENIKLLSDGMRELGLELGEAQAALFGRYLEELKKWNRVHSITSVTDDREIVISHFLDSILYLRAMDDGVSSLADVGSGGGFPGVPLRIMRPTLEVHLVEPVGKKAAFLRTLCGRLGLRDVKVHQGRIEECRDLRVDAAVTRALFSARKFHDIARPVLNPGGRLVLSKGPRYEQELEEAGFDYEVTDVKLPYSDATRHIIVIRT